METKISYIKWNFGHRTDLVVTIYSKMAGNGQPKTTDTNIRLH